MKNYILVIIVILVILAGITISANIAASECAAKNPMPGNSMYDLNTSANPNNPVQDSHIQLTGGAKSLIIEYTNITPINGSNSCYFQFTTYNAVTQNGEPATYYESNIIDTKTVSTDSNPVSGSFTLNTNGMQSIGIRDSYGQGEVKLIMNESRSFDIVNFIKYAL